VTSIEKIDCFHRNLGNRRPNKNIQYRLICKIRRVFAENISVFADNISVFAENISVFAENISVFAENVSVFARRPGA
jgi:hypothetical protein